MADNRIQIIVQAEVAKALAELEKVRKAPKGILGEFKQMFSGLTSGWKAVAGVLSGVVAVALAKVTQKGIEFLDLNDDFSTFFKGIEGDAEKARNALVKSFGFSTTGATKLLQSLGQVGNNLGFTRSESLRTAESIGKLAAAWGDANPNGIKAAQAADIFRKALQGNYKWLRELGIAFDENDVKNKAVQLGLIKTGDALNDVAKAQATMALLTERSTEVMASFSAQGGSLAERLDRTKALVDDLTAGIGGALAGKIEELTSSFDGFNVAGNRIEFFRARAKDTLDVIVAVVGLALIPLEFSVRSVIKEIAIAGKALTNLKTAFNFLKAGKLDESFDSLSNVLENLGEAVAAPFEASIDQIKANYSRLTEAIKFEQVKEVKNTNEAAGKKKAIYAGDTRDYKAEADKKKQIDEDTATVSTFLAKSDTESKKAELDKQYRQALAAANRLGRDTTEIDKKYKADSKKINEDYYKEIAKAALDSALSVFNSFANLAIGLAQIQTEAQLAAIEESTNAQLAALDRTNQFTEELSQREKDKRDADNAEKVADLEAQLAAETDAAKKAEIQKRLDRLNADIAYAAETEAIQAQEAARNAEIAAQEAKIKQDAANKEKAIKKKAAEEEKKAKLAMSVINGAVAFTNALAFGVPPFNFIAAGAAAAAAIAQTALIESTPIPAFAEGGIVNGAQVIMAGERGREAVLPNELTELLLNAAGSGGGGAPMHITVVANDPIQFNNQLKRRYGREVFK